MKYNNIAACLAWETEPETASEGIFLQPEEAAKIDGQLGELATAKANEKTATDSLATANTTIQDRDTEIADLKAAATTATDTISNHEQTIKSLNAKIVELGGKPSGSGTQLASKEDETVTEKKASGKLPRYDDPNHPANAAAANAGIPLVKK